MSEKIMSFQSVVNEEGSGRPFDDVRKIREGYEANGVIDAIDEREGDVLDRWRSFFYTDLLEYLRKTDPEQCEELEEDEDLLFTEEILPYDQSLGEALAEQGFAPDWQTAEIRLATDMVEAFQASASTSENDLRERSRERWGLK